MKNYVNYLSEVLGVQKVMMPSLQIEEMIIANQDLTSNLEIKKPAYFYDSKGPYHYFAKVDLVILNWVHQQSESLFEQETSELFSKMFQAMKLDKNKILILDCVMNERPLIPNELFKICDPQYVLFFSSDPNELGQFQLKGSANWIETLSPAYLIKDPQSKKLVWNDLQKIMKGLQN